MNVRHTEFNSIFYNWSKCIEQSKEKTTQRAAMKRGTSPLGTREIISVVAAWSVTYFTIRLCFFLKVCDYQRLVAGELWIKVDGGPYDMPFEGGERTVNKIRVTICYVASQSVYLLKYDSRLKTNIDSDNRKRPLLFLWFPHAIFE